MNVLLFVYLPFCTFFSPLSLSLSQIIETFSISILWACENGVVKSKGLQNIFPNGNQERSERAYFSVHKAHTECGINSCIAYFSCHHQQYTSHSHIQHIWKCGFETAIAGVFISHKCATIILKAKRIRRGEVGERYFMLFCGNWGCWKWKLEQQQLAQTLYRWLFIMCIETVGLSRHIFTLELDRR